MVRGVETFVERRILLLAEPDVAREPARRHDDPLAGAVGLQNARLFVREDVAFAHREADDAPFVVFHELLHLGAKVHFDAELGAGFGERARDAAAGAFDRLQRARHGVAAEVLHEVLVLHAVAKREFVGGKASFHDHLEKIHVREAPARADHVGEHALGRVFDPELLLKGRARHREGAAVDGGVAAVDGHLFDKQNRSAFLTGFKGGGEAGKARTHDDHVVDLVKTRRFLRGGLLRKSGRSETERAADQEAAAGLVGGFHGCLLGKKKRGTAQRKADRVPKFFPPRVKAFRLLAFPSFSSKTRRAFPRTETTSSRFRNTREKPKSRA